MLALEAQYRGISESVLIDKIISNAQELAQAEAMIAGVSSPSVTSTVSSGKADAAPSAILSGSPQVSGTKVTQMVIAGQDGTNYDIVCKASGADGVTRWVLSDVLPVVSA